MLSYRQRASLCRHPVSRRLLSLMETKKTQLALSADLSQSDAICALAEEIGPEICLLKTHIDIIEDFSPSFIQQLTRIAERHNFLLFEDRKFADIGTIVRKQYEGGIYRIASWAHLVNAHILPGEKIVAHLREAASTHEGALLLIAEMSSEGMLADKNYQENSVKIAEKYDDFVIGFIAQRRLCSNPHFIYLTPGIHLQAGTDGKGQNYHTPEDAIRKGSDILIAGRAITTSSNPLKTAQELKKQGWQTYEKLLSSSAP
jgi:uridine monophosphate synthetase